MRALGFVIFAAAVMAAAVDTSAQAQDIGQGQILFNQRCAFCHTLTRRSKQPLPGGGRLDDPMDLAPQEPVGQERPLPGTLPSSVTTVMRGPHLSGLIGRQPGSLPNFAYGKDYGPYQPEWNARTLDVWIDKHDSGRTGPEARRDIIAYLETLRTQ